MTSTDTPAAQLKQAADKPEDFGHEPMDVYTNGKLRTVQCARGCAEKVTHYDEAYRPSRWLRPVPWPCATAVVLGLTAREVAR